VSGFASFRVLSAAATDPLKQVTVAANARAVVDFAVSRDGTYSGDPEPWF
jgi:hypothetical protein